jgi:hypothetical protein
MPKFLDHHPMPTMSPDQLKAMIAQIKSAIDSKKADKFGINKTAGCGEEKVNDTRNVKDRTSRGQVTG